MSRRKAVAGSLLVQAGLGSIVSWAMLFTSAHGRAGVILSPAFPSEWVLTAGLLSCAVAALASASLIHKFGARKIAAASGVLLGAGFISTSFFDISALGQAAFLSGVLGFAAGLAYIISIDIGIKWYPEKRGTVTGFILAGAGFGGLGWFRVQEILVTWVGLPGCIVAMGSCAALLVLAGSFFLREPPAGYIPPVWRKPENPLADLPGEPAELKEIVSRPAFYVITGSLLLVSAAAVFFSGNLQYVCNEILVARGLETQLAARITLLAAAIFAISDNLGRIAWGTIADSAGTKLAVVILCAVETLLILLVSKMGGNGSVLIFGTFVMGTAFGGILTIYPCIVCEYIGEQEFFKTYSLVFAVFLFMASAILQASGILRYSFGASTSLWLNSLFFSAVLPLAGGAVMLPLKKSRQRGPARETEMLQNDLTQGEPQIMESRSAGPEESEEDEAIQQNNRETEN